jgi:hypothetical protein
MVHQPHTCPNRFSYEQRSIVKQKGGYSMTILTRASGVKSARTRR